MNRLQQDAYDSLKWYEHLAEFRARWARTKAAAAPCVGRIEFPPPTERELLQRKQDIEADLLPF